ncbi:hypothetical protein BGX28_009140 [Mortierella sp. GBA30]|nr:hypothetical protein BGX28_009140 [Mortierella sp. GBA30]
MASKVTSRWAHGDEITGVAYTPDGSYIVTSSEEFTMHLFPQKNGAESNADKIETQEPVTSLVVTKDHIFTGSSDTIVRQYDLKSQEFMGIIIRCDLKIRCLAISPDQNLLAVATEAPEIKMINREDSEKCWSFKGHKKAVNSLSFDPLGEFLISSSCDGTVIIWNLKSKDATPLEIINVMAPTTTDSLDKIPVAWHPSNEFFVIGKDKDIVAHYRHTWKKSFTYRSPSTKAVRCLAWSPNGKFLAASTTDAELMIWHYKEKESPHKQHKHRNGNITGVAWTPDANRLVYADTAGELSRWDNVIDEEKGLPFNPPKPDPVDSLFDDAAMEDNTAQDQDMAQEFLSDNESLNDFIVDDDNGGYLGKKPASNGALSKSALVMQPAKELHPRFQSGSTSNNEERRYLEFNLLGLITTVSHGTHATVSVEFHDKVAHRGYHFTDNSHFSMGCLGISGALFAAASLEGNPSTVFYKTYDSWATKSEWQVYLPAGEEATAIALNAESAIVATSRGYVRVFSQSGIQTGLFSVGSVIAAAGKDDMVLLVYHLGEPFEGSQNLGYSIYNVETGQRIQQGTMPVSDDICISWLGFSEGGIPAFVDDKSVVFILNYYRRVDQGQWTPILDTSAIAADSESDFRPHYWPVGLTDEALTCVKCRRGETEPSFPKPFVTELPLRMPTLYQESLAGQHEEAWLRQKILSGLNKDEKMAMSVERTDNVVAKKELEMDKLALQMIDLACKSDRTQKALDLTAMLCNLRSVDAAVKIAHHHNLHSLMERMNKVKEIKMMEEQDRDPSAELDLIMANPVLAEPSTKDQRVYKVSSREEEQELERKTFQRKDPIKANDPFGRRVVKESNLSKNGGSGSGAANPFKKKSGSDATGGAPKGFGKVVKDNNGNALPITRRATDVFEAADYVQADEQRSRNEREKQSRQDDLFRKRKANGTAAGSSSTAAGAQKTLNMFSKPSITLESSSSAEVAKRLKTQQDEATNEIEDMDTMMDADEFLEPEEEDREESPPPAAQRIPATQEDEIMDASVEETRGYLEKTRVASSLSPARSSSSVLAGFKFSKA